MTGSVTDPQVSLEYGYRNAIFTWVGSAILDVNKVTNMDAMSLSTSVEVGNESSEVQSWQYIRLLIYPVASKDNLTRNCAIWSVRVEEIVADSENARSLHSKMTSADQIRLDLSRRRNVISADKLNMWKEHVMSMATPSRVRVKSPVVEIGQEQQCARQFLLNQMVEMQWINSQIERYVEAHISWNLTVNDDLSSSVSSPLKRRQRARTGQSMSNSPRICPDNVMKDLSAHRLESLRSRQFEVYYSLLHVCF